MLIDNPEIHFFQSQDQRLRQFTGTFLLVLLFFALKTNMGENKTFSSILMYQTSSGIKNVAVFLPSFFFGK